MAEACVSLRLILELFYLVFVLLWCCYCGAWMNKIDPKKKQKKYCVSVVDIII